MKIGFDVDGVLADFSSAYQRVLVGVSGRDLFKPGDAENPPCWDWDKYRGYRPEERAAAWDHIRETPEFTLNMAPIEHNMDTLRLLIKDLERNHDVYFITSRVGKRVKRWTEVWLMDQLCYPLRVPGVMPTVLIATHRSKGRFASGLGLDVYIDDNYDNVNDVAMESPLTRTYLRTRRYNQQRLVIEPGGMGHSDVLMLEDYPPVHPLIIRVDTLGQMLDYEINNL